MSLILLTHLEESRLFLIQLVLLKKTTGRRSHGATVQLYMMWLRNLVHGLYLVLAGGVLHNEHDTTRLLRIAICVDADYANFVRRHPLIFPLRTRDPVLALSLNIRNGRWEISGARYKVTFVQYLTPPAATARFLMPLNPKKYVISAMRSKQRSMSEGELYERTNVPLWTGVLTRTSAIAYVVG
jgi:hypothetical protein